MLILFMSSKSNSEILSSFDLMPYSNKTSFVEKNTVYDADFLPFTKKF